MKILIIGDAHFKTELPYASLFEDGRKNEWNEMISFIFGKAKDCDEVVLMGDNFNTRHNHSGVIKDFVSFLNGFGKKNIHILRGNHETYGLSSALDFIKEIGKENWNVYLTKETQKIGDVNITFLPFMTPAMLDSKDSSEASKKLMDELENGDILFAHHGITGASVHGNLVDLFNEVILDKSIIEKKFKKIFAGHIHNSQILSKKTIMTGSIFTSEMGEHEKSIWILDTNNMEVEEYKLPVRGIYKVDNFTKAMSMPKEIPEHSIVKIIITDSALIEIDERSKLALREMLFSKYDAHIVVEERKRERRKVDTGKVGIDLSIDNLIKVFAKSKGIRYTDIQEGLKIINNL